LKTLGRVREWGAKTAPYHIVLALKKTMSILSHNAPPDALPDFRNLGVIARILVIVNLAIVAVAAIRGRDLASFSTAITDTALIAAPVLLGMLIVLYLAAPALLRLPYATALGVIFAAVVALAVIVGAATREERSLEEVLRAGGFALLLAAFIAGYFHLRNRAFSPALAEARLQALQARIRPHFLFNSLNAVLSLIRTDPKRAELAIEDLAELYRMLMTDTRTLTSLEREIEVTRQYLNLEHLRLGERLLVEWDVDEAPADALVPPLLLQPLVENAVYHGIEPGAAPGTIRIAIAREGDRVHVALTNPYHPEHQHRQGNRMALANIRERLALHFDAEAKLESGAAGATYVIRMTMPYRRT
jgi:two-component system sensor histidine kinase AlgZ